MRLARTPHRIASEAELAQLAIELCGRDTEITAEERALVTAPSAPRLRMALAEVRERIVRGGDPLGDAFCTLRDPVTRRGRGATYTPTPIIEAMMTWARDRAPARIVDPGVGSGRFLAAAGRLFPQARLIGIDIDPLATLLSKAHLAALGFGRRAEVHLGDYRTLALPEHRGPTFFVGNPPYVRHHGIEPRWKDWLRETAAALGTSASQLAGLHVHFFLRTATLAKSGDYGCFITAAEWLDVNYGAALRRVLVGSLGVESVHVIEPTVPVFSEAASTAVVTCFVIQSPRPTVSMRRVTSLDHLATWERGAREIARGELAQARRWTPLTRPTRVRPSGMVELGELCRVHRGQVTGANHVWVLGPEHGDLPGAVLFPSVTRAKELFAAAPCLGDLSALRLVIDLPEDLSTLAPRERRLIDRFLARARAWKADCGYIARARRCWWSVGLRSPAPILATYMARRPPAFVRNVAGARHINIAHGLYPRQPFSDATLDGLVRALSGTVALAEGRTYAGGLTKFEPKEMERLLVPMPEDLALPWHTPNRHAGT